MKSFYMMSNAQEFLKNTIMSKYRYRLVVRNIWVAVWSYPLTRQTRPPPLYS